MHGSPLDGQFIDVSKVTRVELLRPGWGNIAPPQFVESVQLSVQDDGRTLKVFLGPESEEARKTYHKELGEALTAILREGNEDEYL